MGCYVAFYVDFRSGIRIWQAKKSNVISFYIVRSVTSFTNCYCKLTKKK